MRMYDFNNQLSPVSLSLEEAYSLIMNRARQFVNQLIDKRGNDKPPFSPEEYASLLGIKKILREDLGKVSGMLLRFHDGHVIKVNKKHNLTRQNFSCAHEIAHDLLRELKITLNTENISYRTFNPQAHNMAISKTISQTREYLCDSAATELLMPERVFSKYLSNFGVSIHVIERLANIFRVSIRAAIRRIAEVSEEPCIALLWQPLLNNKLLRLILCEGPGINLMGKSIYVPVHTKVKYPSILHKAYEQNNAFNCYKSFKFGTEIERLPMESKGFGRGENRYVVSIAYPER